jgi:hypothetical protein
VGADVLSEPHEFFNLFHVKGTSVVLAVKRDQELELPHGLTDAHIDLPANTCLLPGDPVVGSDDRVPSEFHLNLRHEFFKLFPLRLFHLWLTPRRRPAKASSLG